MPRKTDEQILRSLQKMFQKNAIQAQPSKVNPSKPVERQFLKLKISLKNVEPSIWRRIVVPNNLTLEDLHEVLQVVMGWENAHLYEFIIGNKQTARHFSCSMEMGDSFGMFDPDDDGQEDAADFDLTFLTQKGTKFLYVYDFGDSWEHEIVVENPNYNYSGDPPVFVLAGERNCPPEDCGGIGGYYD
ncbi:MAG: plasmid pRiA4b ORF-3 family protein, partial [Planctomycetaceae bacterium]|nr:plasmid pRiA4b ORF-3 family protein [Planctomycetaceae bacterium]